MAQDKTFACEECTQEFVVPGTLYARRDWVLQWPCCGSTAVLEITDATIYAAAHEAA